MELEDTAQLSAANQACLKSNNECASQNRRNLNKQDVLVINVMSGASSGKTSLLEHTIDALQNNDRCDCRVGIISGDIESDLDAQRYRDKGVPVVHVSTGCQGHLSAKMVHDALHRLPLDEIDILLIENVGNLICPANFDLGHHQSVALLSIPEGDQVPLKFTAMFRAADLVLMTKADYLDGDNAHNFDPARAEAAIRSLGNDAPVVPISVIGSSPFFCMWIGWLINLYEAHQDHEDLRPKIHNDGLILHPAE